VNYSVKGSFVPQSSRKCLAKAMSASSVGGGKQNHPQMNLRPQH
jgi:hypothetical protein